MRTSAFFTSSCQFVCDSLNRQVSTKLKFQVLAQFRFTNLDDIQRHARSHRFEGVLCFQWPYCKSHTEGSPDVVSSHLCPTCQWVAIVSTPFCLHQCGMKIAMACWLYRPATLNVAISTPSCIKFQRGMEIIIIPISTKITDRNRVWHRATRSMSTIIFVFKIEQPKTRIHSWLASPKILSFDWLSLAESLASLSSDWSVWEFKFFSAQVCLRR